MSRLYDTDYHAWTRRTAADLRAGRLDAVDLGAVAEEIEDLGKFERRALEKLSGATPFAFTQVGQTT